MNISFALRSAVCAAALLSASSGAADVTAEDVWAAWQENLEIYNTSSEVLIGSVTVNDAGNEITVGTMTFLTEDEFSKVSTEMGPVVISENGDGTVAVIMPERSLMSISPENGFEADIEFVQDNLQITVSGSRDAMNYDVTADSYTIRVAEFKGEIGDNATGDAYVTFNDISGTFQALTPATETLDYSFKSARADLLIDLAEVDGENYLLFSGKLNGLNASGTTNVPADLDFDEPDLIFVNGFGFSAETGYRDATFIVDAVGGNNEHVHGTLEMGLVGLNLAMDSSKLGYGFGFEDVRLNGMSPQMPFPLGVSWDTVATGFEMPTASTDDPQPFKFLIALTEFTFADELWDLVDPAGLVPHDPLSVEIELGGMAKLFFDLFDPVQTEALAFGAVPGEVYAVDLLKLRLAGAGAEVTGEGALTFDNDVLDPVLGTPRPEGEISIGIKGANALIDTAVSMGLLPEEQASMGRLFMGLFTTPVGDDALASEIEFTSEGHILANGQRIQ